jgi:hypothetical protein
VDKSRLLGEKDFDIKGTLIRTCHSRFTSLPKANNSFHRLKPCPSQQLIPSSQALKPRYSHN